jgi:hypothetical protein
VERAALGVAVTNAVIPAVASDPVVMATAMKTLRNPTMIIRSLIQVRNA